MLRAVELPDVERALVLDDSGLVVVDIKVIWRGEYGHETREVRLGRFTVHAIPIMLLDQPIQKRQTRTLHLEPHVRE